MDNKLYILTGPDEGKCLNLQSHPCVIVGKSALCEVQIKDSTISRYHLLIYRKYQKTYIADLGSKNGTFIRGEKIEPGDEVELIKGTPIVIGRTVIGLVELSETSLKSFSTSMGICKKDAFKPSARMIVAERDINTVDNIISIKSESSDIDQMTEKVMSKIFRVLRRIDRCVIILLDYETGKISRIKCRSRRTIDDPERLYNRDMVGRVLSLKRPAMICDSYDDSEKKHDYVTESLRLMKIRSAMCVPIYGLKIFGAVYVDSIERPNGFRKSDLALLTSVLSGSLSYSYRITHHAGLRYPLCQYK